MELWDAAQSWALCAIIGGGLGYYYYASTRGPTKNVQQRPATTAANKQRTDRENRPKPNTRPTSERAGMSSKSTDGTTQQEVAAGAKKQNVGKKSAQAQAAPAEVVQLHAPVDEIDMSTKQFAQQMTQARQGHSIAAPKDKTNRVKTVKQGSAREGTQEISSGSSHVGAEAEDDVSPVQSSSNAAGDVSDMLEPTAKGPSTLRLTPSTKPQKDKVVKKAKGESDEETKKQRQNRQKIEERRLVREEEERQRKALEEKQRRVAREARGEPARNGVSIPQAPSSNPWSEQTTSRAGTKSNAPAVNGSGPIPLLDTFDAESTGSSNGGMKASTAATSTSEHERVSEEAQMARAMKESGDESGWTTVEVPKKQQKKKAGAGESTGDSAPVAEITAKVRPAPAVKPLVNGKPKGFQALEDLYQQRTDADPNDASNWDA